MKRNIILISILALSVILLSLRSNTVELFLPSYDHCIKSGYTKAFCSQGPYSQMWPGQCVCGDGSIGNRLPGFMGRCICDNKPSVNITINKQPIKKDSIPVILKETHRTKPSVQEPEKSQSSPSTTKIQKKSLLLDPSFINNLNNIKNKNLIISGLVIIIIIIIFMK
tara:strand:+ start:104 stop:604 length:501 start_codon:yes stop_codon:yes gene_type:complete